MGKKQILEALFDADEIESLWCASHSTTIGEQLDWGLVFYDEKKGAEVLMTLERDTKGFTRHMRGDGYLNDNVLVALLYQKYQEYVLGKPAIILWNESDPEESNGWHGINVWVAEDSIKEIEE